MDAIPDVFGWAQAAVRHINECPSLWWLTATITTLLVIYISVKLYFRPQSIYVPHPGKKVQDGEPEVIICGSGVMGSALGAVLARDGRRVTIIERDMREPDRIVGEFMHPGGMAALKMLQLEACTEDIEAQIFKGYLIHDTYGNKQIHMPLEHMNVGGRAFHHGRFVMQLRKAAMAEPNVTYIEGNVLDTIEENGAVVGVTYTPKGTEDVKEIRAPLTVLGDGLFSKFRKSFCRTQPTHHGHMCGVYMKDGVNHSKYRNIELVVAHPYAICYKICGETMRALVDIPTYYIDMPKDIKKYLMDNLYPSMPEHMKVPFKNAVLEGRYKMSPTFFLPDHPVKKPGAIMIGDSVNARHPLTAGGMSTLLNDIVIYREILKGIPDLYDYSKMMTAYHVKYRRARKAHAFAINVFAYAFYHMTASPDPDIQALRTGVLSYMNIRGAPQDAIKECLAVVNTSPCRLLTHFTVSLLYASVHYCWRMGLLRLPLSMLEAVKMFWKGNMVAMPVLKGELLTYTSP